MKKLMTRNFIFLLGSQIFSILGTTIIQMTISLYILDKTHSSVLFSTILSLSVIGRLICLPFSGILADRMPKRSLMIMMDVFYAIIAFCLILVSSSTNNVLFISIFMIFLGIISAFETPVIQSTIPMICLPEQLPKANGLVNSIAQIGTIIGPIIAGIMYTVNSLSKSFIVCNIFFAVAIVCEVMLKIDFTKMPSNLGIFNTVKNDYKVTANYMKHNYIIVKICAIAFLLNLFASSFIEVMIPFVVRIQIHISSAQFGLMNMLFAFGTLMGTMVYGLLTNVVTKVRIDKLILMIGVLFGLLIIPILFIKNKIISFWVLTALIMLILGIFTIISIHLISYVQLTVRGDILGKTMSLIMVLSTIATPIGQMLYGIIGTINSSKAIFINIMFVSLIIIAISNYSKRNLGELNAKHGR